MSEIIILAREAKNQKYDAINEVITLFEPKIKKSSQSVPQSLRNDLEQELRWQLVKAVRRFQEPCAPDFLTAAGEKKEIYCKDPPSNLRKDNETPFAKRDDRHEG